MEIICGGLMGGILGVCLGNTLWLAGLIIVGVGIWGLTVSKESITKAVGAMSLMTGGKPAGFALKLKGLIDPVDQRRDFGRRMLAIGIVLLIIGSAFVSKCS